MKAYKLKHVPTGLFFQPTKGAKKCNLSEVGKLYYKKPSHSYLKPYIRNKDGSKIKYNAYDWRLIGFSVRESREVTSIEGMRTQTRKVYVCKKCIIPADFCDPPCYLIIPNSLAKKPKMCPYIVGEEGNFEEFVGEDDCGLFHDIDIKERNEWFDGGK